MAISPLCCIAAPLSQTKVLSEALCHEKIYMLPLDQVSMEDKSPLSITDNGMCDILLFFSQLPAWASEFE